MMFGIVMWGLLVGLCVGFTAIGTGILGGPGLILLFQLDPVVAVGTISLSAIPMMAAGAIKHAREKNIEWKIAALFSLASVPSAYFTARYASAINEIFPLKNIIAIIIFLSLPLLIYRYHLADRPPSPSNAPSSAVATGSKRPIWLAPLVGLVLGAIMGASGVSGSLAIISFLLIFHLRTKTAIGTASLTTFASLLIAGLAHYRAGNYDLQALTALLPGVIGGSYIGAAFVNKAPRRILRYTILAIIALSGVMILLR